MYWQIGNEQYGVWERSHMTPPMYVEAVREIAPAIRRACPTARIIALGQELGSSPPQGGERPRWRDAVIEALAEIVDALALQIYCIVPPGDEQVERHRQVLDEIRWLGTQIENAVRDVEKNGHDLKVGLSEWNLWTEASHFAESFAEPMDIQHGVFAASVFHHFMRLAPRFEFANYYHLIAGMGLFSVERDEVHRSLVAQVFNLYREVLPAEGLELEIESPRLAGQHPALTGAAVHDAGGGHLFLVNRAPDRAIPLTLRGGSTGAGRLICGESLNDTDGAMSEIPASSKGPLELPPLSIARLPLA
jgi:alpha-L-arabinofuranosidase